MKTFLDASLPDENQKVIGLGEKYFSGWLFAGASLLANPLMPW